jgi:prepilin-type N-terminal cleavage/methylation domain-containing protein
MRDEIKNPYTRVMNASSKAFTLVELMLVVTIIAIMAGAAIPNFSGFLKTSTIKHATNTLAQIIRYTRSLSIEQSAVTKLTLDQETGRIEVLIETDPLNIPGQYEPVRLPIQYPREYRQKVTIGEFQKQTLNPQPQENQTPNEITFQPSGMTTDTFIYISDQYDQVYTIGIVGLTGQIMVWNYAAETFFEEQAF